MISFDDSKPIPPGACAGKTIQTSHVSFMFHYPSQLSHLWGRGPRALSWNAVIRRVLPQIIAMSQVAAFCRKSPSATKKYLLFTVPTPPRRFHIYWRGLRANSRGSRPNISCPEGPPPFPYKVWGALLDRPDREALAPQNGRDGKILVRKTLLPFPYMLSGSLHPYEALCPAIQKFFRPAPPSPFPL